MSTIECFANRGRRYWVTFDESGDVTRVKGETRVIWRRGQRRSITAECAMRAAQAGEAGTATTTEIGVVHEHAVPEGDAPKGDGQ